MCPPCSVMILSNLNIDSISILIPGMEINISTCIGTVLKKVVVRDSYYDARGVRGSNALQVL